MQRITASVVLYGGADVARQCVDTVAAHTNTDEGFTLYLIDNASPDDALQTLQRQGLPAVVNPVPLAQNNGFGAGHNAVLAQLNSRYHAVINPDIEINDDVLNKMADWMDEHPDVAITIPKLYFPSGEPQYVAKRRPAVLPLLARQLGWGCLEKYERHYLMLDEDLSKPTDVEFCSGSFFMIRTAVYQAIGGFDEKYFMYVEDADITQKALQKGRAVYLPFVRVTHKWRRAAHKKGKEFFWQLKSMLRYFRKWGFRWK